jgi:hypothetical protein
MQGKDSIVCLVGFMWYYYVFINIYLLSIKT